jgi:hypothetical protein
VLLNFRSIWGHHPTGSFEEDEIDGVITSNTFETREMRLEVSKR